MSTAAPETPEAPAPEADWLKIETRTKMPYDNVRFMCMQGGGRVWACDGEYVACRPKSFHEGTRTRHENFLASGHYEHVGTFDDVQIFKLLPGSPFRRDNTTFIPGVNLWQDMRQAARAAVARDWVLYTDILEEIASNLKRKIHPDLAKDVWEDTLSQIMQSIYLRGGPSQAEIDAGLSNVRTRRGAAKGRVIAMPARRA